MVKITEEEETTNSDAAMDTVNVENHQGKFKESRSVHQNYAERPDYVDDICLAQFATYYTTSYTQKLTKKECEERNAVQQPTHHCYTTGTKLPKYLFMGEVEGKNCIMTLRTKPLVIRIHKFKEHQDSHEYYYSEMLLYLPWRRECEDLFRNDHYKCKDKFESEQVAQIISINKTSTFPLNALIPNIEELIEKYKNTEETGNAYDPQGEMDNMESNAAGIQPNPETDFLKAYETNEPEGMNLKESKFPKPIIPEWDELLKEARSLSFDQQLGFQEVLKFYKDSIKHFNAGLQVPQAPLILIHGSGGTGKSKLINVICAFGEYYFRKIHPGSPDKPVIIKTAPTGKAASNIDGFTLHSTFNFKFGNDFSSLNDQARDSMRDIMANLKLLIIDEISMVKADMLYILDRRLREVTTNQRPFGNIGMVILGDLMQLKPVLGALTFGQPKQPQFKLSYLIEPIFDLFEVIELTTNHRQNADHVYGNFLKRLRMGEQTEEDINLLRTHIVDEKSPLYQNAVQVYGTNELVNKANNEKLTNLQGEEIQIEAHKFPPKSAPDYNFITNKNGCIGETPFKNILRIKTNAIVMLIYNVNTADKLTNGQRGIITNILFSDPNTVSCLIIKFDDPTVGKSQKEKNIKYSKYKGVPLFRTNYTYAIGKSIRNHSAMASVLQFPLTLAWAMTAHKMQGQTVFHPQILLADLQSMFGTNMAYVVCSRVQFFEQLYFTRAFKDTKIATCKISKAKCHELGMKSINNHPKCWSQETNKLRISMMNIRSLKAHLKDLQADFTLMQSDVICLTETWIPEESKLAGYQINAFKLFAVSKGRGKGAAMYVNKNLLTKHQKISSTTMQTIKLQHHEFDLFTTYFENNSNIIENINIILNEVNPLKKTIIVGDFNTGTLLQRTQLQQSLQKQNFRLLINAPTHEAGNTLDNIAINYDDQQSLEVYHHALYCSDHDAICFRI